MSLALALKYRPTRFQDLVGQDSVTRTLSLALQSNHIAHAYLFSGLRGSGKTSSARIFARALQCQKAPISDPCNECDNCKESLAGKHMDIIEMDAASSRKIEDIRNLIEQTRYAPSYGRYKIFIIDEVHMLTKEAFNALLKTLEEPPSYIKFILATTDPLKLPSTILSRTQHFAFKKIPYQTIQNHLRYILEKEQVQYDEKSIEIIARSGKGSLRDTLTLTDQAISFCNKNLNSTEVTNMLGIIDPLILRDFFISIKEKDDSKIKEILEKFEEYEADMILDEMMLYLKESIRSIATFSLITLDRYIKIIAESKNLLSLNCDGGFILLLTALKMQEAQKFEDIQSQITALEQELSQNPSLNPPTSQLPQEPIQNPIPNKPQPQITSDSGQLKFDQLIAKLYDRDFKLGEIFKHSIHFHSFENNTLTWISQANLTEKEFLTQNFQIIKSFTNEIFGENTKILSQPSQPNQPNQPNQKEQTPTSQQKANAFYERNQKIIDAMKDQIPIKAIRSL